MDSSLPGCILLVEDDENDIILMERACRKANFNIQFEICRDGDRAVQYLETIMSLDDSSSLTLPLLVLLDLKLPRRSGLEVLTWIRQHPTFNKIPVIILTASDERLDIKRAYELHANSYLVKPISFQDLVHLVQSVKTYWLELNRNPEFRY
ncbi:MAG: response regulator [Jaaginema sp. PMC 1079.18]|nr:response regulator [Jaaginema sp. PMC 1080.18]MEC4850707.1 response regulator [Jaaginema sp. PMC 1079.18]MEC4864712.1 response regulator [Jaaginema sp. PMC 1078.18]